MSSFISLRNHSQAAINQIDFISLKKFEEKHPELYEKAKVSKPQKNNIFSCIQAQATAFNRVFNHPRYGDEFKKMIEEERVDI